MEIIILNTKRRLKEVISCMLPKGTLQALVYEIDFFCSCNFLEGRTLISFSLDIFPASVVLGSPV